MASDVVFFVVVGGRRSFDAIKRVCLQCNLRRYEIVGIIWFSDVVIIHVRVVSVVVEFPGFVFAVVVSDACLGA